MEKFERKVRIQRAEIKGLQKDADSADTSICKEAAEFLEFMQPAFEKKEKELEMERYFLQWTEQQRIAMDPECPTPVEVDRDNRIAISKAVRRASVSDRSILGEPAISKRQTRKRDMQPQKPKIPGTALKPAPPAVSSSPATSIISQVLHGPETKLQRTRSQAPRRQLPPYKVSKAKRSDNANTKLGAVSRQRAIRQKRSSDVPSPRQSKPALVEITTRSGRVSRPPVKWIPV